MSRFTLKFWIFKFWIFKFYPINPILFTIYFILHLNWVMTWIHLICGIFFFIYNSVYSMLSHFLIFLMTLVYKLSLQKWQLFLPKVFHAMPVIVIVCVRTVYQVFELYPPNFSFLFIVTDYIYIYHQINHIWLRLYNIPETCLWAYAR